MVLTRQMAGRGRRWRWALAATAVVAALVPAPGADAVSGGATIRVSVASDGGQGRGGGTPAPAISGDGRYVAFSTRADGLVPDDTNGRDDIFVHDRQSGTTTRVSVSSTGSQGNGGSFFPDITPDGRWVAFGSGATDLVPGDTNANPPAPTASVEAVGRDVFVHDRQTGVTQRVSVASDGTQGGCFSAGAPAPCGGGVALADAAITADGRFVAYGANAQNLVPGDTNGQTDVFLFDRQTSTTTRVSVDGAGAQVTGGASLDPAISADGRFVAFRSAATNLVAGDTNANPDVFVRDRVANTTTRVSVGPGGVQAVGSGSLLPSISADGRFVAFSSAATNLVDGDTNGVSDVFVHDRQTSTTTRVSVGAGSAQANDASFVATISADGRWVSFDSAANNLVAGDTNGVSDVFVHDRQTGTNARVSVARDGSQSEGGSFFGVVNADGRYTAFSSDAANLVPGDSNDVPDVFVNDRTPSPILADGYRLAAADGGIFAFGAAAFAGSTGSQRLNQPIVGTGGTPSGKGYWLVARDGGIFGFGDAPFAGSTGALKLNQPIVGMGGTPLGKGYWLVAADGGIFAFGDAVFRGSTGAIRLAQPIVGMASTPSGKGYWLVARDGGVFAFGDAVFRGSTGAIRLAQPIVGMASTPSGKGYWLAAADGGIFAFGDAAFLGSAGALTLSQPIVAMAATPSGKGYWLVARDGGIFAFGDAGFLGSTGAIKLTQPIVGLSTS